jgi:C1A family cysteine protease
MQPQIAIRKPKSRGHKISRLLFVFVTLLLLALLSACNSGGKNPSTLFTPDNSYGSEFPGNATELTPEEFEQKVKSGELTLMTAKGYEQRRQAALEQFQKDKAFLEALPDKSDALKSLLAPQQGVQTSPMSDRVLTLASGQTVLTLGDAVMYRSMVEAYEQARNPENALSIYHMSYDGLTGDLREKLPMPDSLKGKPLEDIQKALADLNTLLETIPNLDGIEPEDTPQSVGSTLQSVVISEGGRGAGNGMDQTGDCGTFASNSVFNRLDWPLKSFITPVKDQGFRGTCWAFAAVAAIESRERVVNDRAVNLSEQYFVNVHQRDAIFEYDDGDFSERALDKFVDRDLPIALETAWTYNPTSGAPTGRVRNPDGSFDGRRGVCNGYTGFCSESIHQSPTSCARVTSDIFCGYERVDYSGSSSVRADRSRVVWENSILAPALPVATMRNFLANGQTLTAAFGVHPGFDNANESGSAGPLPNTNQGYVTNFTDSRRGDHEVLIVGFAPDSVVPFAPSIPGGTGGGFFIIKNSWGCDAGDAGYYYIPVRYIQRFFYNVRVLEMTSARSAAWNDMIEALRPPSMSLAVLGGGLNVDLNRSFEIVATLSGGGAGCCSIQWLPTPRESSVRSARYRFATEGEQTIRATARTSRGIEVMRDIVVNVINTPPTMRIVSTLLSFSDPVIRPGTSSNLRATSQDPNEPGGVLSDDGSSPVLTA